jgi:hypothetical protein
MPRATDRSTGVDMSNDRLHDYLDGEVPRDALRGEERRRAEALDAAIRDVAGALRSTPVPDLTARVMAALPEVEAPAPVRASLLTRLGAWLWRPVTLTVRPAYAFAGVAVAVSGLLLLPELPTRGSALAPVTAAAEGDAQMYVQFRIEVPDASEVAVAGTFTGWQPEHELTEVSPGVWSAMVPLPPGVHDYTFVIDGERMVVDPYAPRVADSFGGSNSRLFLPAPNGSA